jgi:competence protein ComEA
MEKTTMNLKNQLTRILCGAGLALTFAVAPAALALSPTPAPQKPSTMSAMSSTMGPVDINTATVDQLKAVPGIGDVYAARIIKSRPYSSKDQLVTKGVLPQGVYDKVKGQIVAHRMKK